MTPGPLLLVAGLGLLSGFLLGPRCPRLWSWLTSAASLAGLAAALFVLVGTEDWEWRSDWAFGGELLHLRLDGLSAVFLVLLGVVGGAGALYSRDYWSDEEHPDSASRGRSAWSSLMLCIGSVFIVSNGLHFLIAWELFTISAFFLITLERQNRDSQAQGWLYLAASHAGTLALFAFFASLSARTGGWDLGPMNQRTELASLFWLALFGFGVKAGVFPLHVWLPSVHASSPSHVSAILSGVAIKVGLYGILRFGGWLSLPLAAPWVVLGLGAVSALIGICFAFVQNDFKRLLAYCSVENVGIILTGVGAAMLASQRGEPGWGRLVLAAALLHVWNHGAFKALLFLSAGSVLHATGTRDMSRLGGLWRQMPWTAGLFALAAMAASGLPPLNGFVSEWLLYLGMMGTLPKNNGLFWAMAPALLCLAAAGAFALASFVKVCGTVFLGAPRTEAARHVHDCTPGMRAPMVGLGIVCLFLALAPALLWPLLSRAAGSWNPLWGGDPGTPVYLSILSWAQLGLLCAGSLAAWVLWRRCRAHGVERQLTWDCGYAAPAARMQYSGGSFSGHATGWFSRLMGVQLRLRRPRGLMPLASLRVERVPETILERVVAPAGVGILWCSTAVRHLQHGRLQAYILYLVAGLGVLSFLIFMGASQ